MSRMVLVRKAAEADTPFLEEMLLLAADWRSEAPVRSVADIMSEPTLARYVVGWPRPGDVGVVAEASGPVGAAWWRFFKADDPGYGFVDAATPEVSVAVRRGWRGQGIGKELLPALIACARAEGIGALSLSVERGNYAVRLYERLGFVTIAASGKFAKFAKFATRLSRSCGPGSTATVEHRQQVSVANERDAPLPVLRGRGVSCLLRDLRAVVRPGDPVLDRHRRQKLA